MDTLKASRLLETKGFTRDQAEGIAEAIAETGLVAVKRDVDVLKWMVGVVVVLVAATLWQVFGLRGELAAVRKTVGRIDGRLAGMETRMGAVENRLTGIETRMTGVEGRLGPRP